MIVADKEPGVFMDIIKNKVMEYLSKEEYKREIIAYFEANSGMTIEQAKEVIKKRMKIDKYGNIDKNNMIAGNVKVFYTNNPNYGNGVTNGYGAGWYITNRGLTGGSTVKI